MDKIEVEILGISTSPSTNGAYAILLKEIYGTRRLPIIIGAFEAQAIAVEIEGVKPPRPLTHDLMKNLCNRLDAKITDIVIRSVEDNTFYANIHFHTPNFNEEIDARPSDAIALAVRANCPIYVEKEVMEIAAFTPSNVVPPQISNMENINTTDMYEEERLIKLEEELNIAVEKEEYEKAAEIRDEITKLKNIGNPN